jgi:uncharacterized RDD family membrane protein YckC
MQDENQSSAPSTNPNQNPGQSAQQPTSAPPQQTVDPIAAEPKAPTPSSIVDKAGPEAVSGEYAGFWIRLLAAIIDGFILGIVGSVVSFIFGGIMGTTLLTQTGEPSQANLGTAFGLFGAMNVVLLSINIAYYVVLTGTYGATLGKMVLGLRVVDTNGQKISYGKAALREIVGKWISSVVLGLGYLWVAFDEKKQGWHDKIAGTYVVKTR